MRGYKFEKPEAISQLLESYYSGNSIEKIGKQFGIATGLAFRLLKENGCAFRKTGRARGTFHLSDETKAKLSERQKGRVLSAETRAKIAEAKATDFNGMNGYGHTKKRADGYIAAYAPKHPYASKDGYVMLHRIVIEQSIGRYLTADESVHHINHIRDDNRIENLQLMTFKEHAALHMKERHMKQIGVMAY